MRIVLTVFAVALLTPPWSNVGGGPARHRGQVRI